MSMDESDIPIRIETLVLSIHRRNGGVLVRATIFFV